MTESKVLALRAIRSIRTGGDIPTDEQALEHIYDYFFNRMTPYVIKYVENENRKRDEIVIRQLLKILEVVEEQQKGNINVYKVLRESMKELSIQWKENTTALGEMLKK